MTEQSEILPPQNNPPLHRNSLGLIDGVNYVFDEDGFINWRAMIDPKFLYPNKGWFERNNQPVPDSIDGLEDHQLLCKLGGWNKLASLRGFKSVRYKFEYLPNGVSAICAIKWIPNYEDQEAIHFESSANSITENCGDFMAPFKESQAENRAFSKCVRKFLKINIVGDDEIDKSKNKIPEIEDAPNPLPKIQTKLREKIVASGCANKDEFLAKIKELSQTGKFEFNEAWQKCDDIPTKEARIILGLLGK